MEFAVGFGELVAFFTAFVWAVSCHIHANLTRVLGSTSLSLVRLPVAAMLLFLACKIGRAHV